MKRTTKNIICIVSAIVLITSMFFTMNYAKNNLKSTNSSFNQNENMPPDMNNNSTPDQATNNQEETSNDTTSTKENNTNEPPAKPDGDMSEPPEKPDGDTSEPPAKPDGDTSGPGEMSGNNSMPSSPRGMPGEAPNMNTKASLTWPYYLAFAIESLILSWLIIHLVMSNFNKKTVKETYKNTDKILINILGTIILTIALTYSLGLITSKYFLTTNTSNMNNSGNISYQAQEEITTDKTISSGTYSSSNSDENAISLSGDITATISNVKITKTGDSDGGDNTSFYGTNSALIAKDGANVTLKNITVETSATGANGVFSYGGSATTENTSSDNTTITISDSTITTTKDNSGGIMTTGGGLMKASNLTINTAGTSSAAIRTDRGGGTVTVDGGTYTTTGTGSPTIYSTADITVSNATLNSSASEGVVIEGKNSITLNNVKLTDTNNKLNGKSTTYKNIFLYQSMSGDASTGTATFTAKDSTITTNKGDTIYVTNTKALINLTNNTFKNTDKTGAFLRIEEGPWGTSGSNGGEVTLNATNQKITGDIYVDASSTLELNMTASSYEGSINNSNTAKKISLKLDKDSSLILTADTYVTTLEDADPSYSNINFNGYKLYVNGTAIN